MPDIHLRPTSVTYPASDLPMLAQLEALFRDWHQHFVENAAALVKHFPDDLGFDGFYPNYTQGKRILFIGRESREILGLHNMDVLYPAYRPGRERIGVHTLDQSKFHSRMLRIAYGIRNGLPGWSAIPSASEIGDTFGDPDGVSFAFMNISKFSNEGEDSRTTLAMGCRGLVPGRRLISRPP